MLKNSSFSITQGALNGEIKANVSSILARKAPKFCLFLSQNAYFHPNCLFLVGIRETASSGAHKFVKIGGGAPIVCLGKDE